MYCEKCGAWVEDGQQCSCLSQPMPNEEEECVEVPGVAQPQLLQWQPSDPSAKRKALKREKPQKTPVASRLFQALKSYFLHPIQTVETVAENGDFAVGLWFALIGAVLIAGAVFVYLARFMTVNYSFGFFNQQVTLGEYLVSQGKSVGSLFPILFGTLLLSFALLMVCFTLLSGSIGHADQFARTIAGIGSALLMSGAGAVVWIGLSVLFPSAMSFLAVAWILLSVSMLFCGIRAGCFATGGKAFYLPVIGILIWSFCMMLLIGSNPTLSWLISLFQ